MNRLLPIGLTAAMALSALAPSPSRGQDEAAKTEDKVSFLEDVAPILIENCVGCHNPKKAESRYDMTTFSSLARGGAMYEGITLEPGDPDLSALVELIRPDGIPRMPYEQDPLPEDKRMIIERWVAQGAVFDGEDPEADWVALINKATPVTIPESYPYPMPITALSFSADGSNIIASGYHELNTYQIEDGSLSQRSPGLGERIYDVALSPDGSRLATASGDPGQAGYARLWTVADDGSFADPQLLVESDDTVFAVAFSPDGKRLAVGGADRALRVFNVESGETLAEIEDHADWVLDVAFSPDGKRLATASRDKTSKLFDAEKYESLVTFPGHGEPVYCVAFSPDGATVASGGGDNQVRLWNPAEDAKQVRALGGFGGPVFDLRYLDDGKRLAACGADKNVRLFDPSNGKATQTYTGHQDWVYRLAVSPDGKALASGSWDGEVRVWDLAENALRTTILAAPGYTPDSATADETKAAAR